MTPVEPERIISRAAVAIKELLESPTWRAALDKASIGAVPLFVRSIAPAIESRTGRPTRVSDYYVVSIDRGSGASARFAFDADSGDLLEAVGVQKAGDVFRPYVDTWPIARAHMPPGTPATAPASDVVWRPCRESTSRFAPFWRYYIEGQPIYVRSDGEFFRALTTTGRG